VETRGWASTGRSPLRGGKISPLRGGKISPLRGGKDGSQKRIRKVSRKSRVSTHYIYA